MPNPPPTNRLLASLPAEEMKRISVDLSFEPIAQRQMLQRRDEPLRAIHFPGRGSLCSLVMPMPDGADAELAMVGSEGFIGIEAVIGLSQAICDVTLHATSERSGYTLSVEAFHRECAQQSAFAFHVTQYVHGLMSVLTQSIACNGLHSAQARCCRWLLQAHDRLGTTRIPLTHELLATMLGVRRPTVSIAIEALVRQGILTTDRGVVHISDAEALSAQACECYRAAQKFFSCQADFLRHAG